MENLLTGLRLRRCAETRTENIADLAVVRHCSHSSLHDQLILLLLLMMRMAMMMFLTFLTHKDTETICQSTVLVSRNHAVQPDRTVWFPTFHCKTVAFHQRGWICRWLLSLPENLVINAREVTKQQIEQSTIESRSSTTSTGVQQGTQTCQCQEKAEIDIWVAKKIWLHLFTSVSSTKRTTYSRTYRH